MIIRSANVDDLTAIQDMEADLCRKHRVGKKLLYPILQQADFHPDVPRPARVLDCVRVLRFQRHAAQPQTWIRSIGVTLLRLHNSAAAHACLLGRSGRPGTDGK